MSTALQPQPVMLTVCAAEQIETLIQEERADDPLIQSLYLRIAIQGGGCSGFQYQFSLTPDVQPNDHLFEQLDTLEISPVHVLVDSISYLYLTGATIDYQEDGMGARFIVRNPNASTTCSCGDSFSIED